MKHLSFIPSFVSRLVLIFAAITTLGVANAYAQTWTVAGSSTNIVNGGTWNPSLTSNDMTNVTGTWWALLVTGKSLTNNTMYYYKVCQNHAWTTTYGCPDCGYQDGNAGFNVATGGNGFNIIYTYNSSGNAVTAVPFKTWTVVGNSDVLGSNWNTTDAANEMAAATTYEYTLTKSNVSLTGGALYECKVVPNNTNGEWAYSFPSSNKTFSAATSGNYNVTFRFNIVTKEVNVALERVPEYRTIYFINSGNWTSTMKCHVWEDGGAELTAWPGADMTLTGETDDCGHAIWSYNLDIAYNRVIFNNGSSQTSDLTPNLTNPYYHNNNNAWYSTPPAECSDVYFVNTEGWTDVYCYAWNPGNNGSYPGVAMTPTGDMLCGKPVYRYHLTGSFSHCIFSAGAGKAKTRDLNVMPNGYFVYNLQQWYANTSAVTAACVSSSGNPVMTSCMVDTMFTRKVNLQVGAVDDTTPFEDLVYYCELETPMGETYKFYQITFLYGITGYFRLINLIPCSDYKLTIWAIDNDGNVSDNNIVFNFTTDCDALNLYLRGAMNSWATNDADWQFQYHTYEHDRFILIHDVDPNQQYRLWDNGYKVYGPTEAEQQPLYTGDYDGTAVFTATGTTAYVSSIDEIYVVGPAVADGANPWDLTNARKLTWDNPITATWEGNVTNGAEYKLVVRHTSKGGGDAYQWECWDYFGAGNATYNETFTHAILTFDLLTWTWKWTNADDNLCQKTGFPPAGMTPPDFAAAKHFQMGYEISIYTPDATHLYVTAKSNDWAKKAGSATPIFMIFPQEDANLKVLEMPMVSTGTYDANGNEIFELTITQGQKANNYTAEDLVEDFTMGACIRWAVKFPYAGGFSVTDPMYYYIREGCAPYYFNIYHHDDLPGTKGDTITTFKGGEILQPIIYYRKFTPGAWETLCLPFTCSAVRVYDPDDDKEYDLLPQHNSENAEYWLRTFGPATYTERDGFQPNWQNVPVGVNLPEKDVPYIMQVPSGNYYTDKYVMFYGKGYQTIANKTPWTKGSSADGFRYFGNTTMWPQNLGQAYMISADGLWFEKSSGNTLYPFECYVVADPTNTAKYVRFGGVGEQAPEVATGVPNVNDDQSLSYSYDGAQLYLRSTADTPVSIYSVDGRLILSSDLSAHIESAYTLVPGIYVVSTKLGIYKLAL